MLVFLILEDYYSCFKKIQNREILLFADSSQCVISECNLPAVILISLNDQLLPSIYSIPIPAFELINRIFLLKVTGITTLFMVPVNYVSYLANINYKILPPIFELTNYNKP